MSKIPYGSSSFRIKNPHLFGGAVGKLCSQKSQPDKGCEVKNSKLEGGQRGARFRVKFILLRRRLLDSHDNLPMSCKQLADRLVEKFGLTNDADGTVEWSYEQVKTKGKQGTLILIEPL